MSHEKKMKELMGRLVSMSPEPPPFPEEIPMASRETGRRPSPVLVFAAAVLAVAVLAVPVILLTGGEEPAVVATTSTTVAPFTTTTAQAMTTTIPETTTTSIADVSSTAAVLPVWSQPIFVYQVPENSYTGNPALVPIWVEVSAPGLTEDSFFTSAIGAAGDSLPDVYRNAIPPDVEIVGLSTANIDGSEVLVVDMNEAFLAGAGGLLADTTMLNQLIYTLTIGEGAGEGVLFTVSGEPVEAFGTEGLVLTDPVNRQSFIDELSPIFLTEPVLEVEHVYVVTGLANVFEASLIVQVIDGNEEVVYEEPVQASCGSGCWGEFGVGVDSDLVVRGESSIRLLTYSPEDGSPTNVITIPIAADDVWQVSGS